ncbi:MAG: RES family NAD+ phosphorylase [Proteobacteria bacterium]|nr:RES family NAD+ phosphorylase [Pseudomonadota bacterium]
MIQAWRVIKKKHLPNALSGDGARLGGGRWNHVGIPVVYASETLSLAVLELFIHFTRRDITISKSLMAISVLIPDAIKAIEIYIDDLATGWNTSPPPDFTRDIGTKWAESNASALLRVPSAVIPGEHNFVINVKHPDFVKITVGDPRPFALDDRVWKY